MPLRSFKDPRLRNLFNEQADRHLDRGLQRIIVRKIQLLEAATELATLKVPPGNRLEALKGDRHGTWSIRVNRQ